ncbi:DNA polymerase kappa subunit [Strigomonas culicis]|uniref:DNA polymerase kappa n=1 Tax=Strigomonas culicis TaxID=28005 RepID=S9TPA7_9TRYP|nr:DNA polymerase kappa subunit [Strigomonas culicis]|eukprot:EPY18524.1 DNA polymerase kappa subunit [Strigomonas culicis]
MEVFNSWPQLRQEESAALTPPDPIRIFVHIDMDMFYAAVEEKKNPALKDVPFAVGSKSMLSTSNYIARQYGVRSGMPGFIAKRLCPELQIIPTDYKRYGEESAVFQAVCRRYDAHLVSLGWDEPTMEIGSYVHTALQQAEREAREGVEEEEKSRVAQYYDKAADVVARVRAEVHEETGLTCSAGIGISPTFAKFASNVNKPNGQLLLPLFTHEAVMNFLRDTSVREIPGIGESTEQLLHGIGIRTMGDVYREKLKLYILFTRKTFLFLFGASLGVCGMFDFYSRHRDKRDKKRKKREVGEAPSGAASAGGDDAGTSRSGSSSADRARSPSREHSRSTGPPDQQRAYDRIFHSFSRKSVGHERTFYNLKSRVELEDLALRCLRDSIEVLHRKELLCGHIVVKLKQVTFEVKQYSKLITPFPTAAPEAPPSDGEGPAALVYEFENKFYTDQYEVLKYNLHAVLAPVVEHYAQYRLLGVRLEKLISKVHLCAYQRWFAHTPSGEGVPNQRTLQYFFQQDKAKRAQTEDHKEDSRPGRSHGGEERLYYVLSESGKESVRTSSSASSSLALDLDVGTTEENCYITIDSSSQLSHHAPATLEHFFQSKGGEQQAGGCGSTTATDRHAKTEDADGGSDVDDYVVIIE